MYTFALYKWIVHVKDAIHGRRRSVDGGDMRNAFRVRKTGESRVVQVRLDCHKWAFSDFKLQQSRCRYACYNLSIYFRSVAKFILFI
jgi:hypothetical protein